MMIAFDIERLVPAFLLRDKNGYALSKAIEVCLQRAAEAVETGIGIILDPFQMPEWRLDEMVWELDVDWYDHTADLETKRRTIANALEFYIHMGTPGIIQSIIESIYVSGSVEEWFDYDGSPFHFNVYIDGERVTAESHERLKRTINIGKNLRSVLDHIYYTTETRAAGAWAMTAVTGMERVLQGTAIYEEE